MRPFGDERFKSPLKGGQGKGKMKCEVEHRQAMDWIGLEYWITVGSPAASDSWSSINSSSTTEDENKTLLKFTSQV